MWSNGVSSELFISLLEILYFFDLGPKDLSDKTSAEWYLLISLGIKVSETLHTTALVFPIFIVEPIGCSFLINLHIPWVSLTPWDHSYILCHRSLWPFNMISISYNSWAITFSKLNCSCLYIPQLNFCHEIITWPLPIREIGGPWSGSWNWCYEDRGMLWYDWWLLFFSYLFILENPKFLVFFFSFFLFPGLWRR